MENSLVNALGNVVFEILNAKIELTGSSLTHRLQLKIKSELKRDASELNIALANQIVDAINAFEGETKRVKPLLIAQLKSNPACCNTVENYLSVIK